MPNWMSYGGAAPFWAGASVTPFSGTAAEPSSVQRNNFGQAAVETVLAGQKGEVIVSKDDQAPPSLSGAETLIGRELVSGYRIVRQLGEGAMAVVYEGCELSLGGKVALKRLKRDLTALPEVVARAHREAALLARLSHPNIVRVERLVTDPCGEFMVMQYAEGRTLTNEIEDRSGFLPYRDVAIIARDLLRAIEYGHKNGVIHRDIKPENVMVNRDDDGAISRVMVLDYGVAHILEKEVGRAALTVEGGILGTPYYMAPEMCLGGKASVQSDVYALGVTIYYILTRHLLFTDDPEEEEEIGDGETERTRKLRQVLFAIANCPITHIREKRPEIPEKLAAVVMCALAKKASDRWQSVKVFREAFEEAMRPLLSDQPLSMRPNSGSDWTPFVPRPPVAPQFDARAPTVATGAARKSSVPRPRRTLLAVGAAALLLSVAATYGFYRRTHVTRGQSVGTVDSPAAKPAMSARGSPNIGSAPPPRAPASVTTAAATAIESATVSVPLAGGGEQELQALMDSCVRLPRSSNPACQRFCALADERHPFRASACLLAAKK